MGKRTEIEGWVTLGIIRGETVNVGCISVSQAPSPMMVAN